MHEVRRLRIQRHEMFIGMHSVRESSKLQMFQWLCMGCNMHQGRRGGRTVDFRPRKPLSQRWNLHGRNQESWLGLQEACMYVLSRWKVLSGKFSCGVLYGNLREKLCGLGGYSESQNQGRHGKCLQMVYERNRLHNKFNSSASGQLG